MSEVEVLEQTSTVEVAGDGTLEVLEAPTSYVVEVFEQAEVVVQETSALVLEVVQPGAQGPVGPPGPMGPAYAPLVYEQATPVASWVIRHGLGRYPGVTLIIGGRQEYTDVSYPDLDTVLVTWPQATAGRAELI